MRLECTQNRLESFCFWLTRCLVLQFSYPRRQVPSVRTGRRCMNSQRVAVRALLLFGALSCVAQQPSDPQQEPPITTLHADTRLILLDVVVTDKHVKPVRNLSKDDFTIQEEGENQVIASFEAPSGHAPVAVGENLRPAEKSTNQPAAKTMAPSALTILVL